MKKKFGILLILSLLFTSCFKDIDNSNDPNDPNNPNQLPNPTPPTTGGLRTISELGTYYNFGLGTAVGDIDKNNIPDLVVVDFVKNAAEGAGLYYKILYNIDESGNPESQSNIIKLPSDFTNVGMGVSATIVDLNKNGTPDLIFAVANKSIIYQVVYDLDEKTGVYKSSSNKYTLAALGDTYTGIGIDTYDFNGNGKPDLIYMVCDAPSGADNFRYNILYDLDESGQYASTSTVMSSAGLGDKTAGAGIAIGDINGNGIPDIFIASLDSPDSSDFKFRYKILWDVDQYGKTTKTEFIEGPLFSGLNFGKHKGGADCVLYDFNKNGSLDALLMNIQSNGSLTYIIGSDFSTSGTPKTWK